MRRLLLAVVALSALSVLPVALANPLGDETQFAAVPEGHNGYSGGVAFNAGTQTYLGTYYGDGLATENHFEIFGRRVSADGVPVGAPVRLSTTGADTATDEYASSPAVAADPDAKRWLVAWTSSLAGGQVFGQLVGEDGTEIGTDQQFSSAATVDGDSSFGETPVVAYNGTDKEYLVAFVEGHPDFHEKDIWVRRVSKDGVPQGAGSTRATRTDPGSADADNDLFSGQVPALTYNPSTHEYLLLYQRNFSFDSSKLNFEVMEQRLDSAGAPIGAPVRLTTSGTDSDLQDAFNAAVAYDPVGHGYVMVYESDRSPLPDSQLELFAQRLTSSGALNGTATQLTTTGTNMAGDNKKAINPEIAAAVAGGVTQYMVAWEQWNPAGGYQTGRGLRLDATGAPLGSQFDITRGDEAAYDDASDPQLDARAGSFEWLSLYSSDCHKKLDTLPFIRRFSTAASTGPATCPAAGAVPTATASPSPTTATPTASPTPGASATAAPTRAPTAGPLTPDAFQKLPATSQILACAKTRVVLIDVLRAGKKVKITGAATPGLFASKTVDVLLGAKGVGTAVVGSDGAIAATVPKPKGTGRPRYQLKIGSEASSQVYLDRRVLVDAIGVKGGTVVIRGRVTPPQAKTPAAITFRRQTSCTTYAKAGSATPDKRGRFTAKLPPPPAPATAAVYRGETKVAKTKGGKAKSSSFTLARAVTVR